MGGLFSSTDTEGPEPQSERDCETSQHSLSRSSRSLPNEIASLLSDYGAEAFFQALGQVVAGLVPQCDNGEIGWDSEYGWINISQMVLKDWKFRFPSVSIESELSLAHGWLLANPKNRKRRYRRFLESWFGRAEKSRRAYGGGFKADSNGGGF